MVRLGGSVGTGRATRVAFHGTTSTVVFTDCTELLFEPEGKTVRDDCVAHSQLCGEELTEGSVLHAVRTGREHMQLEWVAVVVDPGARRGEFPCTRSPDIVPNPRSGDIETGPGVTRSRSCCRS
jgi:hypothetical protein